MKVTFTIKNLSEDLLQRIQDGDHETRWETLKRWATGDLKHLVKMKVGNGSFGDKVDLNGIVKRGGKIATSSIAPRRGYKLATFEWVKG